MHICVRCTIQSDTPATWHSIFNNRKNMSSEFASPIYYEKLLPLNPNIGMQKKIIFSAAATTTEAWADPPLLPDLPRQKYVLRTKPT